MGIVSAFCALVKRGPMPPAPHYSLHEPQAFFGHVRRITGKLDQVQVDTINELLSRASHWPLAYMAYGLATAYHESGLRPIYERGSEAYFSKYGVGNLARQLGNIQPSDGPLYKGRGLVQITGRANYKKAGAHLGINLVSKPDLALEPTNAARILVWGMETGAFTGKRLSDFLPKIGHGNIQDFVRARRIVNGTDKAFQIADYALEFQEALDAGRWG